MARLNVTIAQTNPVVGDIAGNLVQIKAEIVAAHLRGSHIIVFPEMAICGYPAEDLLLRNAFIKECETAIKSLKEETKNIIAIVGTPHRVNNELFNAAAIISKNRIRYYHKMALPNYGVFDEKRYFTPGSSLQDGYLTVNGSKIAVSICEDMWVSHGPTWTQNQEYAPDLFINLSASPFSTNKLGKRVLLATLYEKPFVYCNLIGGQDELVFDGNSFFVDQGKIEYAAAFKSQSVDHEFDLQASTTHSEYTIKAKSRQLAYIPQDEDQDKETGMGEIYDALLFGIKEYVRKNGFTDIVLGLSGGIDSAVVAHLATAALGEEHVHLINMPTKYNDNRGIKASKELADNFGVKDFRIIAIEPLRYMYDGILSAELPDDKPGVTQENLQARIRGNILMALSNKNNWLVLTTGNKSETAVGYCTLYGDTAGGFAPIKDLYKTQVYELARYINTNCVGRIPDFIINRPPSAELAPGQHDQQSLPPYETLDAILHEFMAEGKSIKTIAKELKVKATVVDRVITLLLRSEYKRRQSPPGIKIQEMAFGRDWRFPLTKKKGIL